MKFQNRIEEVNGFPLTENWYESVVINTPAQDVEGLKQSWGVDTKYRGKECGRCRGRGATRKDENVGCEVCQGLGVV